MESFVKSVTPNLAGAVRIGLVEVHPTWWTQRSQFKVRIQIQTIILNMFQVWQAWVNMYSLLP